MLIIKNSKVVIKDGNTTYYLELKYPKSSIKKLIILVFMSERIPQIIYNWIYIIFLYIKKLIIEVNPPNDVPHIKSIIVIFRGQSFNVAKFVKS